MIAVVGVWLQVGTTVVSLTGGSLSLYFDNIFDSIELPMKMQPRFIELVLNNALTGSEVLAWVPSLLYFKRCLAGFG